MDHGRFVDIRKRRTRLYAGRPECGIDPNSLQRREIDGEPVITERAASDVMSAAANRNFELVPPRKSERTRHVISVDALHDDRRSAIDHRVPDLAGFLVSRMIWN